jgi:hypothetical protein
VLTDAGCWAPIIILKLIALSRVHIPGECPRHNSKYRECGKNLQYEARQFNFRNGLEKARFAYLCTSGCRRLRETMAPLPETLVTEGCCLLRYDAVWIW